MRSSAIAVLLAVLFLIGCSAIAAAADWVVAESSKAGTWYYDRESVAHSEKTTVLFWTKFVHGESSKKTYAKKDATEKIGKSSYDMTYWACDCFSWECGYQSHIVYSDKGEILESGLSPVTAQWSKVEKKTYMDGILEKVCKPRN